MAWISFLRHHPYAPRAEDTAITSLRGMASPGELMSLAVSAIVPAPLDDVEMSATPLTSSAGLIPCAAIDVFIVKEWEQAGIGVYQAAPLVVSELLVKDDREKLRDGYTTRCGHWQHRLRAAHYYVPPEVRLHGPLRTALTPGAAKLVWISIKVPADCGAGTYTGHLEVRAADSLLPVQRLDLQLEILPLNLVAPEQDLLLWYKGTLNCRLPRHYVDDATFAAQLQDIHDHGFTSLSLTEDHDDRLQRALDMAAAAGFRRNVLLVSPFPKDPARIDFHGLTPIYYISDKPDVHGATFVAAHVRDWQRAKRDGALTMASLHNQSFAQRFAETGDIGHAPDILVLYLASNLRFFSAYAEFLALRHTTYYYWLTHMEKPLLHRILAGVYLWKSKAQGIAPYCYQHLPVYPYSPYDDFDQWDPDYHVGDERRPFKDHMTTYPATHGTIPTLQWKALSDGLCDLRYLTTLVAAIGAAEARNNRAARSLAATVRRRLQAFLDRLSLTRINILSETKPAPYPDIDAGELVQFRLQLARDIVELETS